MVLDLKGLIELNRREIEHYLEMLGEKLVMQGRRGSLLLLGGAVMLITVGNRTSTRVEKAVLELGKPNQYGKSIADCGSFTKELRDCYECISLASL